MPTYTQGHLLMPLFNGYRGWQNRSTRQMNQLRGSQRTTSPPIRLKLEELEVRAAPAVFTWANSSGGNWGVATNWSPQGIPGANDDVIIPALASNLTVTHNTGTNTIRSVLIEANTTGSTNLLLTGGTLTITSEVQGQLNTQVTMKGGTLAQATLASGTRLVPSGNGGTLSQITVASGAVIDGSQQYNFGPGVLTILNGLTLNGSMLLGSPTSTSYPVQVTFRETQTISGTGLITFGKSKNNAIIFRATTNGVLTVGSGITI